MFFEAGKGAALLLSRKCQIDSTAFIFSSEIFFFKAELTPSGNCSKCSFSLTMFARVGIDTSSALRRHIWSFGYDANGISSDTNSSSIPGTGSDRIVQLPNVESLREVRKSKRELATVVKMRIHDLGGEVPSDYQDWWLKWERHPGTPLTPTPWERFVIPNDTLEAEAPPP